MAIASFYELPATLLTVVEQRRSICRVIAKAWQVLGEVDILCADPETAQAMDDLLWTFQGGAFIPHGIATDEPVRIHLACASMPQSVKALALCIEVLPATLPPCERLLDFIPANPQAKAAARERYRLCKNAGFTMQVHPLEL